MRLNRPATARRWAEPWPKRFSTSDKLARYTPGGRSPSLLKSGNATRHLSECRLRSVYPRPAATNKPSAEYLSSYGWYDSPALPRERRTSGPPGGQSQILAHRAV